MIKLGIICPIPHLKDFAVQSDFHLVLPHLIKQYPEYKNFYVERSKAGDFVLLDNSIFELDTPLSNEELLDIAEECGFSEVVSPETINDSVESYSQLESFLTTHQHRNSKVQVLAMLQGKSFVEMSRYAIQLEDIKEVNTIGIPFRLENVDSGEESFSSIKSLTLRRVFLRWKFIFHLATCVGKGFQPLHLMGLSDGLELQMYEGGNSAELDGLTIRSNDSSSAFVHGAEMISYEDRGLPVEKISKKLDFTRDLANEGPKEIYNMCMLTINHNIKMLKQFAQYDIS